jgi:CubicO group peptidase (beta-lactamase class C family)
MRILKKILKWTGIVILSILLLGNIVILVSGRLYIYKAIAATYLRGNTGPHIYDLEVFEKRKVPAGTAQPWEDDKWSGLGGKLDFTKEERERIEAIKPASFLVMWGDTLVFEEYWDEHDRNKTSNSFSMAKSVVALLVGVAIEEGFIESLDDPVADYLPEYKGEKENITIRHTMTMSSGLSWSENYKHPFCDVAELYYDTDARDLSLNRREIEEEPGKIWDYKSGDTQVLVYVLKAAVGKSVSEYAAEKLWQPMGAESDAWWSLTDDQDSAEKGYCCLYATTRDFARLGKLINNRGNYDGKQLVDSTFVEEFCSLAPLKKRNGNDNNCYGLQYWIYPGFDFEVTYFRGMRGQYIISVPSEDLVIVRTGDGTEANGASSDGVLENHRLETPFYVEVGMRLLEEFKGL